MVLNLATLFGCHIALSLYLSTIILFIYGLILLMNSWAVVFNSFDWKYLIDNLLLIYCTQNINEYMLVIWNETSILIVLDGTTNVGHHTVYASNESNTWNNGTVLYNGTLLPTDLNFESVFRFLTYVPLVGEQSTELELCEIGIIGEYY